MGGGGRSAKSLLRCPCWPQSFLKNPNCFKMLVLQVEVLHHQYFQGSARLMTCGAFAFLSSGSEAGGSELGASERSEVREYDRPFPDDRSYISIGIVERCRHDERYPVPTTAQDDEDGEGANTHSRSRIAHSHGNAVSVSFYAITLIAIDIQDWPLWPCQRLCRRSCNY